MVIIHTRLGIEYSRNSSVYLYLYSVKAHREQTVQLLLSRDACIVFAKVSKRDYLQVVPKVAGTGTLGTYSWYILPILLPKQYLNCRINRERHPQMTVIVLYKPTGLKLLKTPWRLILGVQGTSITNRIGLCSPSFGNI